MKSITFSSGDTYLGYQDIYNSVCKYVNELISDEDFESYLSELIVASKIVREDHRYYLKEMYDATSGIVNKMRILLSATNTKIPKLKDYIKDLEGYNNIKYNDKQKLILYRTHGK